MKYVPCCYARYRLENNFFVEIDMSSNDEYEAWLFRKDIGVKMFVCGVSPLDCPFPVFVYMVEHQIDPYIKFYIEKYCTDKDI